MHIHGMDNVKLVLPVKLAAATSVKHPFYKQFVFGLWNHTHTQNQIFTHTVSVLQCSCEAPNY
jgi:hypothetical protein